MSIRLNKALRELNIGLQTAVEFLSKKSELGEVKAEPSFKLSDQQYKALNDAFSQDKEVRDQAEKLFPKKSKDKKRAPEQKDSHAENTLKSSGQQQYTPLGKIDLDSIGKKSAVQSVAPVKKEAPNKEVAAAVSHAPVNNASKAEANGVHESPKNNGNGGQQKKDQFKQNGGQNNGQQKQNKQKIMQNQANNNQPKPANKPTEVAAANASGSVFTLKSEKKLTTNEPKVLGKIDLSSLNQSTRPKKKTKEERRKEREEKLAQQHSERKKRVRINKERVDINAEANQNNGGGKNNGGNQNGNNGGGNKKKKNKKKKVFLKNP